MSLFVQGNQQIKEKYMTLHTDVHYVAQCDSWRGGADASLPWQWKVMSLHLGSRSQLPGCIPGGRLGSCAPRRGHYTQVTSVSDGECATSSQQNFIMVVWADFNHPAHPVPQLGDRVLHPNLHTHT